MTPLIVGTIPLVPEAANRSKAAVVSTNQEAAEENQSARSNESSLADPVIVTVTDEDAQTAAEPAVGGNSNPKRRVRLPSSVLSELYPELEPPTFQESLFGKVNIAEDRETVHFGESKFAPKYPCYGQLD